MNRVSVQQHEYAIMANQLKELQQENGKLTQQMGLLESDNDQLKKMVESLNKKSHVTSVMTMTAPEDGNTIPDDKDNSANDKRVSHKRNRSLSKEQKANPVVTKSRHEEVSSNRPKKHPQGVETKPVIFRPESTVFVEHE